ncbi:hypothetical protein H0H87_000744 [Tephrocybe sp. NHM501043]|nr:hypothetical protein H0H87_000744 [Tephrocybe sp. NHM501043]
MLGYGGTDKPQDPSEYSTQRLCADLAALLDVLDVQRAVLIGHDWGAFTVGRFALWHPERLISLIMISVPYTPPSRTFLPIEEVAKLAPNLGYQVDFANSLSTPRIENETPGTKENFTTHGTLLKLLQSASLQKDPSVLDDNVFEKYLADFSTGGMNGPLNYYRTSKHRHEEEERAKLPSTLPPNLPVLFMWGTKDATATPFVINKSRKFINKLQDVAFEGRGHWLMVEAKEEITNKVVSWLQELSRQPVVPGKL